jgi:hypothetical protein
MGYHGVREKGLTSLSFKLDHLIQLCQLAKTLPNRDLMNFTNRLVESATDIHEALNPKPKEGNGK